MQIFPFLVCVSLSCHPFRPQLHVAGLGLASVNPWHKGARLDYPRMWKHLYGWVTGFEAWT